MNLIPGFKYTVEVTDMRNELFYTGKVLEQASQTKIEDSGLTIEEILTTETQTYIRSRFEEFPAR